MKLLIENWKRYLFETEKEQKILNERAAGWLKRADRRVIDDVLRAAEEANADEFSKRLLLGFLKIESGGKAVHTFYNPNMNRYRGVLERPDRIGAGRGIRPIGPFQILLRYQDSYRKYGYDPGQFGDPYHQAKVVLNFIEAQRERVGDDPARIYLSWNQGISGSNQIYRNLENNPDAQIGSGGGLAGRMRGNFSSRALDRYNLSSKSEVTPRIFVDRYTNLLGFEGDMPSSSTVESPEPSVRNIIISGNSHAGPMASSIKQHYRNLGQESGIEYNFIEIHAPQGHGGEIRALNNKMDTRVPNELVGDNVTAIIHIGTNKGHGNLDELIEKYRNLSNNVTFVGSPEASQTPDQKSNWTNKSYERRANFNTELEDKINNLEGVEYVNTYGLTSQDDLRDNVHLKRDAYQSLWSQIQGSINFDSPSANDELRIGNPEFFDGPPSPEDLEPETPVPERRGKFVHGFKREEFPDFDFDKFYQELDTRFADKGGAAGMLPKFGQDEKFGREHHAAFLELQKVKETDGEALVRGLEAFRDGDVENIREHKIRIRIRK